ncbi:MAG: glycosyltransferase family 2 protein [Lachnospiraceae bacterium]|nr:glycosyltransferase family 2 protein [Lachnospiraceae bacterium]
MNNETTTNNLILSSYFSQDVSKKALCVIMPAYNEGAAICNNLLNASSIISEFCKDYIIIAVNDGSKDNTESEIIKASEKDSNIAYISYHQNKGKGGAISTGVHYANSTYTAFLDSDLELSPSMLEEFLTQLEKGNGDIAIGSKLHKESKLNYPAIRKFLSLGYYLLLKLLFRLKIKDTQTGIKLFKTQVVKPICESLSTYGFAYDIEILAKATKKGYSIIEMPIVLNFSRDEKSKSRFSLKVIIRMFKETLKVKKAVKQY